LDELSADVEFAAAFDARTVGTGRDCRIGSGSAEFSNG